MEITSEEEIFDESFSYEMEIDEHFKEEAIEEGLEVLVDCAIEEQRLKKRGIEI